MQGLVLTSDGPCCHLIVGPSRPRASTSSPLEASVGSRGRLGTSRFGLCSVILLVIFLAQQEQVGIGELEPTQFRHEPARRAEGSRA